jgi:hypothetical protein
LSKAQVKYIFQNVMKNSTPTHQLWDKLDYLNTEVCLCRLYPWHLVIGLCEGIETLLFA